MAKKRVATKGRKKKKPSSKKTPPQPIYKILGAMAVLIFLVTGAGLLLDHFLRRPVIPKNPPVARIPVPPAPKKTKPRYEVYPGKEALPKPVEKLPQLPGDHPPIAAIVIDDIGYDRQIAAQLLSIDAPLTFSVLPNGPHSREIAAQARSKGHEIMLHLPMEPSEFPAVNPGPGALLSQMSPDQFIGQLEDNLNQIPGLKGVNNHMGSGISTSPERMRQIFSILKKRGLYYIDSRTTAQTVARPSAELLQLPFAERDIFIDHFETEKFVRQQLKALVQRAQSQGYAVGIAHPHKVTYRVMADVIPQMKKEIQLVPASMVVDKVMLAQAKEKGR